MVQLMDLDDGRKLKVCLADWEEWPIFAALNEMSLFYVHV